MDKIILSANVENIYPATIFVMDRIAEANGSRRGHMVELIIEEVFVNICCYAYPEGIGEVELACDIIDDKAVIVFADTGAPFDPTTQEEPDMHTPLAQRVRGGLGIHLVRQYAEHMSYERKEGKNRLTVKLIL